MPITIEAGTRELLYDSAVADLSGMGDLMLELDAGRVLEAQLLRQRFEDELRLLDDLGWAPTDQRGAFELTMPLEQLTRLLGMFYERHLALLIDGAGDGSVPAQRDAECLRVLRDLAVEAVTNR
jgi:hypothetical protein